MIHGRNIFRWLTISLVSSVAVGRQSLGARGCNASPSSHGLRPGLATTASGTHPAPRRSSSRHCRPGLADRVRVQPALVSVPGLQKVHVCFSNSDLGRRGRQLQQAFLYIHISDSHWELLVIKKRSNEAGFGVHLLAIWYQLSPSLLPARNWHYLIHAQN